MSALIEMPIATETLAPGELQAITGYGRPSDQAGWLEAHGWHYVRNRGGEPIVGRLYARLKLAGIDPSQVAMGQPAIAHQPDLSWM